MVTHRPVELANDQIYHIFNRSVARQPIFTTRHDYMRAVETLSFYKWSDLSLRFSYFLRLGIEERLLFLHEIDEREKLVEIYAWCLMPNHFHFLLRQVCENGISRFISNFTNSYAKYFNTKFDRNGSLFQRPFKAVLVEENNQLIHLSRYIHLNPIASHLIKNENLFNYRWSSLPEYLGSVQQTICDTRLVLNQFASINEYEEFILDRVAYAQELEKIKHLTLEC